MTQQRGRAQLRRRTVAVAPDFSKPFELCQCYPCGLAPFNNRSLDLRCQKGQANELAAIGRIRCCDEHGQSGIIVVQHGVCGAERLDQNRVRHVSRTWALENPGLATTPDKGKMQSGETRIHRIRLEAFVRLEPLAHRGDPVDARLARLHLPLVRRRGAYLDGVALRLGDGTPVIGLTLRYDRIDNFWFCLLHELAHVGRHMDNDRGEAFVDDFTLRKLDGRREDPREAQADEWAEEALIPRMDWEASAVRDRPTTAAVMNLARALQVHPAIVAGRVRYERKNYRLLSQFVGTGEVRRQFAMAS